MLAATVMLLQGCTGPVSTADADSAYDRAKKLNAAGDFKGAADAYRRAVLADPELAPAHFELGLLYDDKFDDPIAAIYHYRCYLELRPDSQKRQMVEDFVERAKLSLVAKLPQSPIADPDLLTRLQTDKAALVQENAALKTRLAEIEGRPAQRVAETTVTATASESSPAPAPPAPASSATTRTHMVQKGDTLQSLALKFYGTRSGWEKIYQANRGTMPSKDQLKLGQVLLIP